MAIRQHWIHGMSTPGNGTEAAAHPIDKAIVNLTKVQTRSMTSKGKKRVYLKSISERNMSLSASLPSARTKRKAER